MGGPPGDPGHREDRHVGFESGRSRESSEGEVDVRLMWHRPAGFGDDDIEELGLGGIEASDVFPEQRVAGIDASIHLVAESGHRLPLGAVLGQYR